MKILPNNDKLLYTGRIDWRNPEEPVFVFPCTSVGMGFTGNTLRVRVRNHNAYWDNYIGYILDGVHSVLPLPEDGEACFNIEVKPSEDNKHKVLFFKRQDACHEVAFLGFEIDDNGCLLEPPARPERKIEIYGDSVSAGEVSEAIEYLGKEDPVHNGEYSNSWYSYGWITARRFNAQIHDIAQGGIALMDNTGYFNEPGQTGMETVWDKIHYNTALGEQTEWDFKKYVPQLVFVAIGQNDSYPFDYMKEDYNGEKAVEWRKHYGDFIRKIRGKYKDAHIICFTTLLNHNKNWDNAIEEVLQGLGDPKVTHYLFKRNGCGTPGHLRIPEAREMADELCAYIKKLGIEGWQ